MADDELWHVRVSENEVKTLTLEQIDDLYRLDVIDADTQLWQDGMDEWLPLRVVAGLDEEEVVNVSIPPTVPPARLGTTASWPPPAMTSASAAASSWPPPSSRPAAPSSRPAAPSSRPAAPLSRPPMPSKRPVELGVPGVPSRPPVPSTRPVELAATVPSWPPTSAPSPGLFPSSYAPPSVPPQVVAEPFRYPRPTNPMPIILAAVVGIVVTLYRNDMLHAGARTVGQEATYLKLEQALGGPGFGTPRAVEPLAKAAAALPDIAPLPMPTSTSKSYASSSDSDSDSKSSATQAPTKPVSTSRPEPRKVAAPQPQAVSRPAPRAEADVPAVFKQPKGAKKAKGNEFDPLNGSL